MVAAISLSHRRQAAKYKSGVQDQNDEETGVIPAEILGAWNGN